MPHTYVYRYARHVEGNGENQLAADGGVAVSPGGVPRTRMLRQSGIPPLPNPLRMSSPASHWLRVESFSSTGCPCEREISRKLANAELKPLVSPTWRK